MKNTEVKHVLQILHLLSFGWLFQPQQSNVVHERGIVESRMDHNVGNIELFMLERLSSGAHVIFTEANLQYGIHGSHKGEAIKMEHGETHSRNLFNSIFCNYLLSTLTSHPRNGRL